ncbi:MAG: hypothetical protein QXS23_00295 [Desulfurococcaceae archaeon]
MNSLTNARKLLNNIRPAINEKSACIYLSISDRNTLIPRKINEAISSIISNHVLNAGNSPYRHLRVLGIRISLSVYKSY